MCVLCSCVWFPYFYLFFHFFFCYIKWQTDEEETFVDFFFFLTPAAFVSKVSRPASGGN